jgi:hypothetical protein
MSRCARDRGTTMVELALVLPLVGLLLFGTLELGLGFVAHSRVDAAVTQAARVGASSGSSPMADHDLLLALQAALPGDQLARLDRVVVYRADAPGTPPPAVCTKAWGSPSEVGSTGCNTYTGATVRQVTSVSGAGFGGGPGAKDSFWAPTSRKDRLIDPPDYLGVWIRTSRGGVTGLPIARGSISSVAVFRLEPDVDG